MGEGDSNGVYEDSSDRVEIDDCATFSSSWLGHVRTVVVELALKSNQNRRGTDGRYMSSLGWVV